jgi:hypothetical protein
MSVCTLSVVFNTSSEIVMGSRQASLTAADTTSETIAAAQADTQRQAAQQHLDWLSPCFEGRRQFIESLYPFPFGHPGGITPFFSPRQNDYLRSVKHHEVVRAWTRMGQVASRLRSPETACSLLHRGAVCHHGDPFGLAFAATEKEECAGIAAKL